MTVMRVPWLCWNECLYGSAVLACCAVLVSPSSRRWRTRSDNQNSGSRVILSLLCPWDSFLRCCLGAVWFLWGLLLGVGSKCHWAQWFGSLVTVNGLCLIRSCSQEMGGWLKWERLEERQPGDHEKVTPLRSTYHLWVQHLPLQQEVLGSPAWGTNTWLDAPASIHHLFPRPRLAAAHQYSLKPRLFLWWLCK